MKPVFLSTALVIMAAAAMAGDAAPAERVKAAVQRLRDAPNYSWRMTVTCGGDARFTPGPVKGQTETGGCTRWTMTFGDRSTDGYVKAGRVAVKTEDGWVQPEDFKLPPPPPPPPGPPPPRDSRTPCEGKKHTESGTPTRRDRHKAGFHAHLLRSMKVPAETAAELAAKVGDFQGTGDEIRGELNADAARELLAVGGHHRKDGPPPPQPVNPTGSVTFHLNDGNLQKIELRLGATLSINGSDVPLERTTEIEIKDVGTTKMDIPAEVNRLLESNPAPPVPEKNPKPA